MTRRPLLELGHTQTKTMVNGLRHILKNFGHTLSFVCAKKLLEPRRPRAAALQGRLIKVW